MTQQQMTQEERERYDARAELEVREHAEEILRALIGVASQVGNLLLDEAMHGALSRLEADTQRAREELRRLEEEDPSSAGGVGAEPKPETTREKHHGEPVPRREEYATLLDDPDAGDLELQAVRCQQQRSHRRAEGNPDLRCTRRAEVWRYDRPLCEEHARAHDLGLAYEHWSLAENLAGDWVRMAEAWHHEDLAALARQLIEKVRSEHATAKVKYHEAREWADRAMVPREDEAARAAAAEVHARERHVPGTGATVMAHLALAEARERLQEIPPATFEDAEQQAAVERTIAEADELVAREARRLDPPAGGRAPQDETADEVRASAR